MKTEERIYLKEFVHFVRQSKNCRFLLLLLTCVLVLCNYRTLFVPLWYKLVEKIWPWSGAQHASDCILHVFNDFKFISFSFKFPLDCLVAIDDDGEEDIDEDPVDTDCIKEEGNSSKSVSFL